MIVLQRFISFVGGSTLTAVVAEGFRLTPGALTVISLVAGFGTAVIVAFINTRHDKDDRETVVLPLERWAAERLEALEEECDRLREENKKLWEQNHLLALRGGDDASERPTGP